MHMVTSVEEVWLERSCRLAKGLFESCLEDMGVSPCAAHTDFLPVTVFTYISHQTNSFPFPTLNVS